MKRFLCGLSACVGLLCFVPMVDSPTSRPLDAEVVRTFENLEWPDWITGADSGPVSRSAAGRDHRRRRRHESHVLRHAVWRDLRDAERPAGAAS